MRAGLGPQTKGASLRTEIPARLHDEARGSQPQRGLGCRKIWRVSANKWPQIARLPDTHSRPPHFATAQRRFAGGPTHWCPPPGTHPIADARSRGSPFAKFLNFRNQQREERSRTLRRTSSDDGETFQSPNGRAILTTRRLRKAADYESGGQEFESLRARQIAP